MANITLTIVADSAADLNEALRNLIAEARVPSGGDNTAPPKPRGRPAKIPVPPPEPIPMTTPAETAVTIDPFAPAPTAADPFAPTTPAVDPLDEIKEKILHRVADKLPECGEEPMVKFLAPQFGLSAAANFTDVTNAIRGATDAEKLKNLLNVVGG